jgi:hypothetical protein
MEDEPQANPVFDQLLIGNELHCAVWGQARLRNAAERGQKRMLLNNARPYSWRRIIFGGVMARQRVTLALLAVLMLSTACQARSSVEAAQTAVVVAQTVVPGAQATALAGATLVSGALGNAQPVATVLQAALQGADVRVTTTPDGAGPDAATAVGVDAIDAQGALGQMDALTRQVAVSAALVAASQYFPNATITLVVKDPAGKTVVSGSVGPGQTPNVQ